MSYVVAQLGARAHYAVPRILSAAGLLERLYTDICATKGWPRLLDAVPRDWLPAGPRRLAGRRTDGIPADKITAFTQFGLMFTQRLAWARTPSDATAVTLWANERFCRLALDKGFGGARGVYAFNGAALELLQAARKEGLHAAVEQTIAPRRVEERILRDAAERFPEWTYAETRDARLDAFCEREEEEWRHADVILCGSEFVRQGVAARGGPVERCVVVPYGVDARMRPAAFAAHGGPLRVLVVGSIGLRKGSPYVVEAARKLKGRAEFRVAGALHAPDAARRALDEATTYVGAVPRVDMPPHFAWADVFLLPSLCEGSALVVYEALSAGLPVVCTPNTGSVVRDGVEGFIVPPGDSDAIVEALERLMANEDLRRAMRDGAIRRWKEYGLDGYGRRLLAALPGCGDRADAAA